MKKEKKVWAMTLIALWYLTPNFTFAQQDSVATQLLHEVVVSGSRSEQTQLEIPRSVVVISNDQIQKSIYNSVGDLLASQAGLYLVGATQTPGTNQSLFMRGAGSNQVAILIDGARINDPTSPNASIDLSELSLTDVQHIEIVHGSHSTLYGGGAIGGVVNIITKRNNQPGLRAQMNTTVGTFGDKTSTLSTNLGVTYGFENGFYLSGNVFLQKVEGLNAAEDTITSKDTYSTDDKDGFRKKDFHVKAGYRKGKWDAVVAYKKVDQHADIDYGAYQDDDNAYLDFQRDLFSYELNYSFNPSLKLGAVGSYTKSVRKNINDSSRVDENNDYDGTVVRGKYNGHLFTQEVVLNYSSEKLFGVLGLGHYREGMDFNTFFFSNAFGFPFQSEVDYDSIDTSAQTNYLFAQATYVLNKFRISVGSRFSHHSKFGRAITAELSPSYRIENTVVYGSLSTGFNAPSLYQLYDPTLGWGAVRTRGNKDLDAERSVSMEVGLKREFGTGSYLTLSAFHTRVKDAIEYVYLWNKDVDVDDLVSSDYRGDTYLNVAEQVTQGIELTGRIGIKKFFIQGNISWLKASISASPDNLNEAQTQGHHGQLFNYGTFLEKAVDVDNLSRRPELTANLTYGYRPVESLLISLAHRYARSRYDVGYVGDLGPWGALGKFDVDSYHLFDVAARFQINKNWSIGTKVENLSDKSYQEILGYATRGRSLYFNVTLLL